MSFQRKSSWNSSWFCFCRALIVHLKSFRKSESMIFIKHKSWVSVAGRSCPKYEWEMSMAWHREFFVLFRKTDKTYQCGLRQMRERGKMKSNWHSSSIINSWASLFNIDINILKSPPTLYNMKWKRERRKTSKNKY